jgi:DNA topoisomerase VI subunit B
METFSTSQLSPLILKTKYSAATTILFKLMCHRFTLNERVMVDDIHEIQNSEIHTRAILDFRDYDSMEDDGSVACVADLLRYVNSTPLLDFMDEGYTCLLSRAMKAVRWNRYGCALKAGIFIEGSSTLLNNPKWEIILTSAESSTFPLLKRVIFIVDIIGGTVPFTSLRKTAISESPNLGKGITRSIETVMNKLQELRPDIFVSKKEAKVMTLKKCIPLIALAVSKLIQFSPVCRQSII